MVEAKHKDKWPPQGQATEHKRRPDQPPQEVPYEGDPNVLKSTGRVEQLVWDTLDRSGICRPDASNISYYMG